MRQLMIDMVYRIQDEICEALCLIDETTYREDIWEREEGGGGRRRGRAGDETSGETREGRESESES